MSLISFSPLQDGVTGVNAAATNTPLSTIYNDYNGNITDANIAAGAAIAFSKISGGTTTALGAFQTYTPTVSNLTVGNGTMTARYQQVGKLVVLVIDFVLGSSSAVGTGPQISLPVTANARYVAGSGSGRIGGATFYAEDFGTGGYILAGNIVSTTNLQLYVTKTDSTYTYVAGVTSTAPFTWGTADFFGGTIIYEAA